MFLTALIIAKYFPVGDSTDPLMAEDENVGGPHQTAEDAVDAFLDWWEKFS